MIILYDKEKQKLLNPMQPVLTFILVFINIYASDFAINDTIGEPSFYFICKNHLVSII